MLLCVCRKHRACGSDELSSGFLSTQPLRSVRSTIPGGWASGRGGHLCAFCSLWTWPELRAALLQASTLFIPLEPIPEWAKQFCRFTINYCIRYHHFKVAYDDKDSLQPGRPHVIGGLLPAWRTRHAPGTPQRMPSDYAVLHVFIRDEVQDCLPVTLL